MRWFEEWGGWMIGGLMKWGTVDGRKGWLVEWGGLRNWTMN